MKNQFRIAVSKALAIMSVTLIMALVLAPGAWAANTYKVLLKFNGTDGAGPEDALVFDSSGNLYGTTRGGGSFGAGAVFELTPNPDSSWTQTVLHAFRGGKDGVVPQGTLVFDQAGSLYGVTLGGGAYGDGTVFKLMRSGGIWKKSVLHQFKGGKDGNTPFAGVVFDTVGNLYGTTYGGANGDCGNQWGPPGCGTVYKLIPNGKGGWSEQVVRRFAGNAASNPQGPIVLDAAGKLYSTTSNNGSINGHGAVFEITP